MESSKWKSYLVYLCTWAWSTFIQSRIEMQHGLVTCKNLNNYNLYFISFMYISVEINLKLICFLDLPKHFNSEFVPFFLKMIVLFLKTHMKTYLKIPTDGNT